MATTRRGKIKEREKLLVWVRAGGRCTICGKDLLESRINFKPVRLGELAHNVAHSDSPNAPRADTRVPRLERDLAPNLVLACPTCHTDIDNDAQAGELDIEWLRNLKAAHEQRVRRALDLTRADKSSIVRVVGDVRTAVFAAAPFEAASAVALQGDHLGDLTFDPDRRGVEVDLQPLTGENDPIDSGYYGEACELIDRFIAEQLRPRALRGEINHLSVFAIARIPVLAYLGSRLDDGISTEIYQRQRTTESWTWQTDPDLTFEHSTVHDGPAGSAEAVLVINASGTVDQHMIPAELGDLTRFVIAPVDHTPHLDTVATQATRDSFRTALSQLLGHIEATYKPITAITKLHVIAAAPVSVAVILGRSVGWGFHPNLAIYDHVGDTYRLALEITAP